MANKHRAALWFSRSRFERRGSSGCRRRVQRGGLETEFLERLDARGQAAVDSVVNKIGKSAPDLTVETAVERTASFEGAAAGVRDYVEENEVDLVVMGSHGQSNLRRQLIGSVTSTVLRTVDVPVLVVKRS